MSIYLIRHPKTTWNVEGRLQGSKEGDLTSEGILAAQEAVNALAHGHIHYVYHADNQRTRFLSQLLNQRYTNAIVNLDARLNERDFGEYEGMLREEIGQSTDFDPTNFLQRYIWTPPQGESYQEVSARANELMSELHAAHTPDEIVFCVTSGIVIRTILHVQTGLSLAEIFDLKVEPLQIFEIPHRV